MELNNLKHELQHILQGKSPVSQGELIQAIATYLRKSTETSAMAKTNEPNKKEKKEFRNNILPHMPFSIVVN